MEIIAHTMQYTLEGKLDSNDDLRNYQPADFPTYKRIYEDCFADLRRALELTPVNDCYSGDELLKKASDIFILEQDGELIGSVAIYGREIDDLIVAKPYRRQGYGQRLLRFAVARMQSLGLTPITLHVADWNKEAIELYKKNGFEIVATERVK